MTHDKEDFYIKLNEPNKSCLLALREIVLKQDQNITETRKWGMPCFCYRNRPFCYLWIDKKTDEPYLLMVEGRYLHHPALEEGKRTKMKVYRCNPYEDLALEDIQGLLRDALALYSNGTIKIK